jgi:hypothetical protein
VDGPSFTVQLWSDTVTTTSSSIYGTSVDFIFDQLQFVDVVGLFYIYTTKGDTTIVYYIYMIQKVIRLYSRLRSYWSIVRPVYYRVSTKTTSPAINAGVGEVGERTTGAEDLESAVFDTARPCLSDPV